MTVVPESWRDVEFRGGGFRPRLRPGISWLLALALLVAWELVGRLGLVSQLSLPSPLGVGTALAHLVRSGDLLRHLLASLQRIGGGWLLGTLGGLGFGFAMGTSSVARSIGSPLVASLFPVPKIALLPLFILWLGIGEASKLTTIAVGVFFPTVISTYSAVDSVPRSLVRMGQSFSLSSAAIVRRILLPGALPGILAGFRISSSIALILVVAAEMIGAEYGVGALILTAGHLLQTDRLLAGVAVLSLLGLAIAIVLERVERRVLRWR